MGKSVRKKRRVAVRRVGASQASTLKQKLEIERSKYISQHPALGIVGAQLVCPDNVIKILCDSAKFIHCKKGFVILAIIVPITQCSFNNRCGNLTTLCQNSSGFW